MNFKEVRLWASKHYLDPNYRININPKTKKFIVVTDDYKYWNSSVTPKKFLEYKTQQTALGAIAGERLLHLHVREGKNNQTKLEKLIESFLLTQKKAETIDAYGHKFQIIFNRKNPLELKQIWEGKQQNIRYCMIYVDGKKVGYVQHDTYTGLTDREMWGRTMPDITRYNTMAFDILEHFKAFILNPNSGKNG